jgi:hypothetical protein
MLRRNARAVVVIVAIHTFQYSTWEVWNKERPDYWETIFPPGGDSGWISDRVATPLLVSGYAIIDT